MERRVSFSQRNILETHTANTLGLGARVYVANKGSRYRGNLGTVVAIDTQAIGSHRLFRVRLDRPPLGVSDVPFLLDELRKENTDV